MPHGQERGPPRAVEALGCYISSFKEFQRTFCFFQRPFFWFFWSLENRVLHVKMVRRLPNNCKICLVWESVLTEVWVQIGGVTHCINILIYVYVYIIFNYASRTLATGLSLSVLFHPTPPGTRGLCAGPAPAPPPGPSAKNLQKTEYLLTKN